MIVKEFEKLAKRKLTTDETKLLLDIASDDIKANRISFKHKTDKTYLYQLMGTTYKVIDRCKDEIVGNAKYAVI